MCWAGVPVVSVLCCRSSDAALTRPRVRQVLIQNVPNYCAGFQHGLRGWQSQRGGVRAHQTVSGMRRRQQPDAGSTARARCGAHNRRSFVLEVDASCMFATALAWEQRPQRSVLCRRCVCCAALFILCKQAVYCGIGQSRHCLTIIWRIFFLSRYDAGPAARARYAAHTAHTSCSSYAPAPLAISIAAAAVYAADSAVRSLHCPQPPPGRPEPRPAASRTCTLNGVIHYLPVMLTKTPFSLRHHSQPPPGRPEPHRAASRPSTATAPC